jgi:hypothetical protein
MAGPAIDAGYHSGHEDDGEDEVAECDSMSACSSGEESLPEGSDSSTDSSSDGEDRSLRLPMLIVTGEGLCSILTHLGCP